MRSQREESYIMIPDVLITEKEEKTHLTEAELYLYSLLARKKNYEGVTETCLAFLHETSPIEFGSSKQRSITTIKNTLVSLMDRKVIKVLNSQGEILNDFKPSDLIIIVFEETSTKGHTRVEYSKFDSFNSKNDKKYNMSDYYIYVVTLRWMNSNSGTFFSSYERWKKLLQVNSEKTARTKVEKAIEKKVIFRNIGNYGEDMIGEQKKQDKNAYRTTPFKESEKTIMTKKAEVKKATNDFEDISKLF